MMKSPFSKLRIESIKRRIIAIVSGMVPDFYFHKELLPCHSRVPEINTNIRPRHQEKMNRNVRECTFRRVRPARIQISLRIRAVWSESSLGAFWIAEDAKFLHTNNDDSDQTAWIRRLIWVFVGRTCQMVRFLTLRLKLLRKTEHNCHKLFVLHLYLSVHLFY